MEVFVVLIVAAAIVIGYVIAKTKEDQPTTESQTIAPRIAYSGKSYPFSEVADDPNFPHVRSIHTKIRGVTKGNHRQQIIGQCCRHGDALFLIREPNNPVDRNAIQVRRLVYSDVPDKPRLAEQIGYVSRELAEELAPKMDEGFILMAWIMEVTGGEDGRSLGVNIQIEEYRPAKHPSAHASPRRGF